MLVFTLAALLQAAVPPDSTEITVTADSLDDRKIIAEAQAYAQTVLPVPIHGQYARWMGPVCIIVTGVDPAMAARVTARIAGIAADAGVKLGKPRCKPNLAVVFTADAAAMVRGIAAKRPRSLGNLDANGLQLLITAPLPVRWWYTTQATDRSGLPLTTQSAALGSALTGGETGAGTGPPRPLTDITPSGPDALASDGYSASLIDSNLAIGIVNAVALVDVPLLAGAPTDAVIDYIAMVTLAPPRLGAPPPAVPSILGLFAGAEPMLSNWDRAFLRGRYSISPTRKASRQRTQLVNAMRQAIGQSGVAREIVN